MTRRPSKPVFIGPVKVGGGAPIVVQSMTKTDSHDVEATLAQIYELKESGCEIVRIAIPDADAARALRTIKGRSPLPIIADVHFDHRLALAALEAGADGLRLNPGNITKPEEIKDIAHAAKDKGVPIRVGVNAGSLPADFRPELPIEERLVAKALGYVKLLESFGCDLIKISLKSFDVPTTVKAYQSIASKTAYPLHIGITEAGPPHCGLVRSAVGLGILLYYGIGDTIRVSLTANPKEEVAAAYEILRSLNLRERGPVIVSCPTCGRTEVNLGKIVAQVEEALKGFSRPIKVAIMGCVVNGPGEARDADIGVACGRGRGVIFKKGERLATVEEDKIVPLLLQEIEEGFGEG